MKQIDTLPITPEIFPHVLNVFELKGRYGQTIDIKELNIFSETSIQNSIDTYISCIRQEMDKIREIIGTENVISINPNMTICVFDVKANDIGDKMYWSKFKDDKCIDVSENYTNN